ncbi:MAG: SDR family oxidoreductase [Gemmatimonadetes bacterium]|nr:SDR family oxidoreductase [Gemmatimonadota bacterium]
MPNLSGKSALVTGSTHGIGLAIAAQLVGAGAMVVVNSRSKAKAVKVAAGLSKTGPGRAVGIDGDVRDPSACAALVSGAVQAFGRLDVLVNNAGVGIMKPIQEMSLEEWSAQIETNLGGVFHCSRAAIPHLKASGDGWIINIASLASRNSFAGGSAYNASKFGLLGMSEAMMLDLRYENIRVSAVMPGSVDTDFGGGGRGAGKKGWALQAEDVARAVLQLLEFPPHALVSRVEMRASRPPR